MRHIVITGGHHNAALVVAQELIQQGIKISWFGHRHSSRQDTADSAEYLEVKAADIPFYPLAASRLILDIREIVKIFPGIIQANRLLDKLKPDAILSFGGYLGGTVALAAWIKQTPIYLHEQTVTAGKANKFSARFARRIYLTWPGSAASFPGNKSLFVGLPLRQSIVNGSSQKIFIRRKPTLLIMGGKQGAHVINDFIFDHLDQLLSRFNIVHQTGTNSVTRDYEKALSLRDSLGSLSDSYLPLGYIGESEIGKYLHNADLYFGRSGAHITYELGVVGIKSILVPLLLTHDYEQLKNARVLANSSLGIILPQSKLSWPNFVEAVMGINILKVKPLGLPQDAAHRLSADLLSDLYGV